MVTDLPKLHDQVHKVLYFGLGLIHLEELFDIELLLDRVVK